MNEEVFWVLELKINDEQQHPFKPLMNEMVVATKELEPETLSYEWLVSEDESQCHIYERYKNSQAALDHLNTFGKQYAKRFMKAFTPLRLNVYGRPNEEVRKALAALEPSFLNYADGFQR